MHVTASPHRGTIKNSDIVEPFSDHGNFWQFCGARPTRRPIDIFAASGYGQSSMHSPRSCWDSRIADEALDAWIARRPPRYQAWQLL
jgi:hypothetical protein